MLLGAEEEKGPINLSSGCYHDGMWCISVNVMAELCISEGNFIREGLAYSSNAKPHFGVLYSVFIYCILYFLFSFWGYIYDLNNLTAFCLYLKFTLCPNSFCV